MRNSYHDGRLLTWRLAGGAPSSVVIDDDRALFSIRTSSFDDHRALFSVRTSSFDDHRVLFSVRT